MFDGRRVCKKCGRPFYGIWLGPGKGVSRECTYCGKKTSKCTCEPITEANASSSRSRRYG